MSLRSFSMNGIARHPAYAHAPRASSPRELGAYLYLAPALLVIGAFVLYPTINLFYLSLCKAGIMGSRSRFIGLANFASLLASPEFFSSLKATGIFTVSVVVIQTTIALLVALLVDSESRSMGVARTILFIPVVLPFVVAAYLWKFLYNPDFGLFGAVLSGLGLPRQGFLADPYQALPSLIATCVWKSWAFFMVIFLAGLKEIPQELHECAILEGASPGQRARYVTLPLLRRTILFVVVVTTMDAVARVFTPVFVMTDGGPRGATDLLVYLNWRTAFRLGDIGYASAMAVFMFVFVLAVNLVQLRVGKDPNA
jgi:multiple sugar transport system permease protein